MAARPQMGIADAAPADRGVDWQREERKKSMLQYTMIGITAISGGILLVNKLHENLPDDYVQIKNACGAIMVVWAVLVIRTLYSYVWFPQKQTGAADSEGAAALADAGITTVSSGADDNIGDDDSAPARRRRGRREA